MSNTNKTETFNLTHASCGKKPRYVKRLYFEEDCQKVSGIDPSIEVNDNNSTVEGTTSKTSRDDYVRQWVETHENVRENKICFSNASRSPVFRTVSQKRLQRSPEIGNRRKRAKRKNIANKKILADRGLNDSNYCSPTVSSSSTTSSIHKQDYENSQERCNDNVLDSNILKSPIIGKTSYTQRRKKRPRCKNLLDNGNIDKNMNKLRSSDIKGTKYAVDEHINFTPANNSKIDEKYVENINLNNSTNSFKISSSTPKKNADEQIKNNITKASPSTDLLLSQTSSLIIGEKNVISIEVDNISLNTNSTIQFIDDVDTQDMILMIREPSKIDSNETTRNSQQISQLSSSINESTKKLTPAEDSIVLDISPPRTTKTSIYPNLLNSGKKRKRPKRGSLRAKLQSLIKGKISHIRLWRHRMKQAEVENTCVQSATLKVLKFLSAFNRYFLEGTVIEDNFNLINKSNVTIMVVPEVAGQIELKYESTIKIYPPWDKVHEMANILNVTYLKIISVNYNTLLKQNEVQNITGFMKVIQEFSCPCIEAGKLYPNCFKSKNMKLNVMEQIFNSN